MTFTAIVTNVGEATAGASSTSFPRDGRRWLGGVSTPALGPGDSRTVEFMWRVTTSVGSHRIKAVADDRRVVTESDKTNNRRRIDIVVH